MGGKHFFFENIKLFKNIRLMIFETYLNQHTYPHYLKAIDSWTNIK